MTGEGLEVVGGWVDALTEAIVGEALSASSPSSSPITHLPSSPSGGGGGGGGGKRPYGYVGGKWFWEWLVVSNASGCMGVGVCTSRVGGGGRVGEDGQGWAYYSTSELLGGGGGGDGGGGSQGKGSSESYGPGDVIGVELDLHEVKPTHPPTHCVF